MIFVTGPLFAGKREYIRNALGLAPQAFDAAAVWDVQCLAETAGDLEALADRLAQKEIVIATEVGGGVVPVDPAEREARERTGRLCIQLAQKADRVVRVVCGVGTAIKG